MNAETRAQLLAVLPLLVQEITRIGDEKDDPRPGDQQHQNSDCGYQLLHELGWDPPAVEELSRRYREGYRDGSNAAMDASGFRPVP